MRENIVLITLLSIIILLTGTKLAMENFLSVKGPTYDQLQQKIHYYKIQNMQLNDIYLHDAAYTTIYREATDNGYVQSRVVELR